MEASKISYTDLLIIGAGPAGLMAAAWASRYNISARIIDKKGARVNRGHADGLQCRTMEILDSFGLADRIRREGFHDIEICSWDSVEDHGIQRSQRVLSQKVGVSRYPQTIIHQGYIEQTILDFIEKAGGLHAERCAVPREISIDSSLVNQQDSYPITVEIEFSENVEPSQKLNGHSASTNHASRKERSESTIALVTGHEGMEGSGSESLQSSSKIKPTGTVENGRINGKPKPNLCQPVANGTSEPKSKVETIKAKYLLGCDGAHSWTRQQLGIPLEGNQTRNIWGVIDIIPLTNFPDIRQTCAIRSATHGSLMVAPREGRLIRLYVQLNEMSGENGNLAPVEITPALILGVAQKILKPYQLDFKYLDWWSIYKIQQRVASQFSVANRIFLAGDAIHTHSPKLGQGMNVSMQDAYNLGWKICSVINGTARWEILSTYETERRQVALDLIAADLKIARYYSQATTEDPKSRSDYRSLRDSLYEFLSGAAVNYGPSILTLKQNVASVKANPNGTGDGNGITLPDTSPLAPKLNIGMRLPSHKVFNQADARCVHLGELLPSDGRWRLLVFAGNLADRPQFRRVRRLGEFLTASGSLLRRYTPSHRPIDSVIEVLTVHSGPRAAVDLLSLHDAFHPYDERDGWDYWKVFADEPSVHEGFDDAYGKYGIDRQWGCLVVCRPDQHVGCVLGLEDFVDVGRYFERILIPVV